MYLNSLIKKLILIELSLIIVPIAMAIFGKEVVSKIMIYTAPILLSPLLLKIFLEIKGRKK